MKRETGSRVMRVPHRMETEDEVVPGIPSAAKAASTEDPLWHRWSRAHHKPGAFSILERRLFLKAERGRGEWTRYIVCQVVYAL
jgi:hypothetical protein